MCLSAACAVHCAAAPVLRGVIAWAGARWLWSETAEVAIVLGSGVAATLAIVPASLRHRRIHLLALVLFAVAVIVCARWVVPSGHPAQTAGMVLGGLSLVLAHGMNLRLHATRRRCPGDAIPPAPTAGTVRKNNVCPAPGEDRIAGSWPNSPHSRRLRDQRNALS